MIGAASLAEKRERGNNPFLDPSIAPFMTGKQQQQQQLAQSSHKSYTMSTLLFSQLYYEYKELEREERINNIVA